ncbi:SWIM zinc finger family protein [Fibrella aquatilis]|uniref:SWIM zinc finger family protein n=1 Tax=Fibrella aquatilis TaxID=2817059 RepID=A0A939G3B2_9BACT|nr:SWIM zinc finger family protein [Fibrella aquatilis]MBO0929492.1 SWIM zinc finger family protein [Fibrella aquatilis]
MLFNYKFGGSTSVVSNANATGMSFAPDTNRTPTFFVGKLNRKLAFREAISALHDVVVSDMRFQPRDKSTYLAWAAQQEELWLADYMAGQDVGDVSTQIKAVQGQLSDIYKEMGKHTGPFYDARTKYFKYLYEKDMDAWFVLDPVITVHPDEVFFECFSQDESSYGKLSANYNVFKEINEFACGTTNVDYSADLYNEFQKIRDYKETDFSIDPSGFSVQTTGEEDYKEVKIDLPDSWVRGFLQVSSAMTLPATTLHLHPMDVYDICSMLRRFKEKVGPRSIRFKLTPGEPVKLVFDPWGKELVCARSRYDGHDAQEIRIWGRRRLLTLERLVPVAKSFTVSLLGSGLPSFWVADLGDMTFTLGLSGWSANDWSRLGNFDLMAPRGDVLPTTAKQVFDTLKQTWFARPEDLAKKTGLDTKTVLAALGTYTQAGRAIYDLHLGVYRVRELTQDPLPMDQLRFANPREAAANKLLANGGVRVYAQNTPEGLRLTGTVRTLSGQDQHPNLLIDADERLTRATCDCAYYAQHKLMTGPCEHMLALRLKHGGG